MKKPLVDLKVINTIGDINWLLLIIAGCENNKPLSVTNSQLSELVDPKDIITILRILGFTVRELDGGFSINLK